MNTIANTLASAIASQDLGRVKRMKRILCDNIGLALEHMQRHGRAFTPKFTIDADNRWVYTQLIHWINYCPEMKAVDPIELRDHKTVKVIPADLDKGIYLCGPTGTGKSLALEVLNEFVRIDNPTVRVAGKVKPLVWACYRAEDIWEDVSRHDSALEFYKKMPILCIQDLGSEPASEAIYMGSRREPLRQILEYRGDRNDLITIISSNYPIFDPVMQQRYSDRVLSRLKGMCNMLILSGKDRR